MQKPPNLVASLFNDDPTWDRIGEAHLNYFASAYNWVKTN